MTASDDGDLFQWVDSAGIHRSRRRYDGNWSSFRLPVALNGRLEFGGDHAEIGIGRHQMKSVPADAQYGDSLGDGHVHFF